MSMKATSEALDHWVWQHYPWGREWAEARGQDGLAGEYVHILRGEPVPKPWPKIRITKISPGELPDRLTGPIDPLVSERLAKLLTATAARIELIPVTLEGRRRKFYLLDVLEHVACLDEEHSTLRRNADGRVSKVFKLVLRGVPPGSPALFRVATFPAVTLVSRELRETMESECEGPGEFVPIEDFRWG